jgi:hypothetical protein
VAHAYNSSYSGGRDQEKFAGSPRQIVHKTLSRKTLHKSRAGGVAQGEDLEFKTLYCKKKNKRPLFPK